MSMVSPNHRSRLSLILGSAMLLANGCADLSPTVYSPTVVPNKWSYAALAGSAVGAVAGNKMSSTARTLLGAGTDFASAHGALGNEILKQQMTPQQPASQINIYGGAQLPSPQSAQQQASSLTYLQGAQGAAAQPPAPTSAAQQRANLEALLLQAQDEYRNSIVNFDWDVKNPELACLLYTYSAINDLNGNSRLDFPEEITFKNIFTTDEQRLKFGIIGFPRQFADIGGRRSLPTVTIVNQHTGKVVSRGECSLIYEGNKVQGIVSRLRVNPFLQAAEYTLEFDKQELAPGVYNIICQGKPQQVWVDDNPGWAILKINHREWAIPWKQSCTFSIIQLPTEVPVQPPASAPVIQNNAPTKSEAALADESNAALKKKLNTLKDMKNAGDITEEEYQLKRKRLLDEF